MCCRTVLRDRELNSGRTSEERVMTATPRDTAGARKHPGSNWPDVLILPPNTACSYLPCTTAPPGTKEALPQTELQVLDVFITQLAVSILSNKRSPPPPPPALCVTFETKPNQDKWILWNVIVKNACMCVEVERGGGGCLFCFLTHRLDTTAEIQQMCPFSDRDRHTPLWQSGATGRMRKTQSSYLVHYIFSIVIDNRSRPPAFSPPFFSTSVWDLMNNRNVMKFIFHISKTCEA